MKYYLDTEFYEEPKRPLDLISIGIVCEDGREYYAESHDYDSKLARHDGWLKDNVYPHLLGGIVCKRVKEIKSDLLEFFDVEKYRKPEIWAYYADYDWVVFCQIFGRMIDLPKGFPMYCRDIKQLCDSLGNPKLPEQGSSEHDALEDARWNKVAHDFLLERQYRMENS